MAIKAELSQFRIDCCLEMLSDGYSEKEIAETTKLKQEIVQTIKNTVDRSARLKNRVLLSQLERR